MKTERGAVIFRFNMVEVALALVILAIGLSSVLVLFPVGLRASRNSIADNSVGDVAERMAAYLQAKYTSKQMWTDEGNFADYSSIGTFDPEGNGTPTADDFTNADDEDESKSEIGMDGLFKHPSSPNCYLYRQYSNVRAAGTAQNKARAVDFEAIIRVGWDDSTLNDQYYLDLVSNSTKQFKDYLRTKGDGVTDDPGATRMKSDAAELLKQFYHTLIIEISWPADVEWAKRERRIFRVEMFNENFVPYPQSASGGGGGGGNP